METFDFQKEFVKIMQHIVPRITSDAQGRYPDYPSQCRFTQLLTYFLVSHPDFQDVVTDVLYQKPFVRQAADAALAYEFIYAESFKRAVANIEQTNHP